MIRNQINNHVLSSCVLFSFYLPSLVVTAVDDVDTNSCAC